MTSVSDVSCRVNNSQRTPLYLLRPVNNPSAKTNYRHQIYAVSCNQRRFFSLCVLRWGVVTPAPLLRLGTTNCCSFAAFYSIFSLLSLMFGGRSLHSDRTKESCVKARDIVFQYLSVMNTGREIGGSRKVRNTVPVQRSSALQEGFSSLCCFVRWWR